MDNPPAALAFPAALAEEVRAVASVMPDARHPAFEPFTVDVRGEQVTIPYRIYRDEPPRLAEQQLSETQQLVLHCLYSRHCDGVVRQRHLEQIVEAAEPWVVPFVVHLAGEYVLQIVNAIRDGLPELADPGSAQARLYGEFIIRNPQFFARTERRMVSYWSCYYRWQYREFGSYPGALLLGSLRRAAKEAATRPGADASPAE